MQLALLPPPKNADWMLETNYQLLLPSFLTHSNKYRDVVHQCAERGDYIILDNGVAEGLPIESEDDLYRMATDFKADEVIIPDVYGNMEGTLQKLNSWKFNEDFKHMAVVAAQSYDEAAKLIDAYVEDPRIDTIALPRLLIESLDAGARWHFAGYLKAYGEAGFEIHLLGTNPKFMMELYGMETLRKSGVRGIDTSAPFVYALDGCKWPESLKHPHARKADYIDADINDASNWKQLVPQLARTNVDYLKERVYGS